MESKNNSLRYRVPDQKLSEAVVEELEMQVISDLNAMKQDREEWLERQEEFLYQWDDYVTPNKRGVWEESANFHVPFTMQQCRGFHARAFGALFDVFPWFFYITKNPADQEKRDFVETLMMWELKYHMNNNKGIQDAMDIGLWDWVTKGRAIWKLRWEEKRERYIDVEMDELGNEFETEVEKTLYAGNCLESVSPFDFYMPAGCTVEDAPVIQHRIRYTKNDLKLLKKFKHFIPSKIDELLEKARPSKRMHSDRESGSAQEQEELEGVDHESAEVNRETYKIIESWFDFDINNDGYEERIVVWVEESSKIMLGWNYASRLNRTGRPPYYVLDFIPRRVMPMGLVELLYPVNTEIDSLHNMRIDAGTLLNVPWGTLRESNALKADEVMIEPGLFLPVENHDDLQLQSRPNNAYFFLQEEELVMKHGELLGMSRMGFGQQPDTVGALGTATGASAMLNEMNRILSVHLHRLRQCWKEILIGVYDNLKELLPLNTAWYVTGMDGREKFGVLKSRNHMPDGVDFSFVSNSATLNRELEKQNDMMWLQLIKDPVAIQIGIATPTNIVNAYKDAARALGKQNISAYINDQQLEIQPLTVEEEINYILRGIAPPVVLNDDHQKKLQALMFFRDGEDMQNYQESDPELHRNLVAGFNQVIKKHAEMQEAIAAQRNNNIAGLNIAPTLNSRMAGSTSSQESPKGQSAPIGGGALAGGNGITGGRNTE